MTMMNTNNSVKIKRKPFQNLTNSASVVNGGNGKGIKSRVVKKEKLGIVLANKTTGSNANNVNVQPDCVRIVPKLSPRDRYLASIGSNSNQNRKQQNNNSGFDTKSTINLRPNVKRNGITAKGEKQGEQLLIIIPTSRRQTMDKMKQLVLGGLYHQPKKVFTPSFAYSILRAFETFKRQLAQADASKNEKTQFDLLFGFTYEIWKNDYWMTHHSRGWGGEKMVLVLATKWRELLKECTPDDLGLDTDVSYPSLLWFLQAFKDTVESVETYGDPQMVFNYDEKFAI